MTEREHFQNSDSFLGPTLNDEHVCPFERPGFRFLPNLGRSSGGKKLTSVAKTSPVGSLKSSLFNTLYKVLISSGFASILSVSYLVPAIS